MVYNEIVYEAGVMPLDVQFKLLERKTDRSTRESVEERIKEREFGVVNVISASGRDGAIVLARDESEDSTLLKPTVTCYRTEFDRQGKSNETKFEHLNNPISILTLVTGTMISSATFGMGLIMQYGEFSSYWTGAAPMYGLAGLGAIISSTVLVPSAFRRRRQTKKWEKEILDLRSTNLRDLEDEIKDISLYQGSIREVSDELQRDLERVDTGNSSKYLHTKDPLWLRARAWVLDADAVVHYQPGSATGTPVKFTS